MAKNGAMSKAEAIRQVIQAGGVSDFIDVVDAVKKRHGLSVSQRMVEETYTAMKQEQAARASSAQQGSASRLDKALRFVQEMGGIEQAKAALAEFEAEAKRLSE